MSEAGGLHLYGVKKILRSSKEPWRINLYAQRLPFRN
jgi:hypothetical protein